MLARVASATWRSLRSFGGKTTWSSDALQRRRQEPRGSTLHVLGHLVFHIQHPTEHRSILPHSSGNCWTQHLYPPLQAILFHSDHVYFGERIHFHRAFRENSKKAGCLLEAWYHTLSRCRQGRFSFFLLLPVQVVTEAHFQHAGMGLLRVVTTCFGCTSFQEGAWNRSMWTAHSTPLRQGIYPAPLLGRARKEFADCIAGIVKGEKLPTVLLADLNFPEKAF